MAYFKDHAELEFCGRPLPSTGADAKTTFMGPASIVWFEFDIPNVGKILLFQTHLPLEPMIQKVNFRYFAEKHISSFMVSYVVGNWVSQWRQDLMVWVSASWLQALLIHLQENKIYLPKPMLVRGDGPVAKLRRWYAQFYEGYEDVDPNESSTSLEW